MSFAPETETLAKPETLLRVPVGLASPLWGLFAGAAMSGAAWWWMTRWTRTDNLEDMYARTATAETVPETAIEPEIATFAAIEEAESQVAEVAEETIATADIATEAVVEPVLEAVAEAPEPVAEALAEPFIAPAEVALAAVSEVLQDAPEAAAEPAAIAEAAPEPVVEPTAEPAMKLKKPKAPKAADAE